MCQFSFSAFVELFNEHFYFYVFSFLHFRFRAISLNRRIVDIQTITGQVICDCVTQAVALAVNLICLLNPHARQTQFCVSHAPERKRGELEAKAVMNSTYF